MVERQNSPSPYDLYHAGDLVELKDGSQILVAFTDRIHHLFVDINGQPIDHTNINQIIASQQPFTASPKLFQLIINAYQINSSYEDTLDSSGLYRSRAFDF